MKNKLEAYRRRMTRLVHPLTNYHKTMKLKIWCDSGANHQSCREETYDIGDLGITEAEWDAMTEDEQSDFAKEIAFDRLDWGFSRISG